MTRFTMDTWHHHASETHVTRGRSGQKLEIGVIGSPPWDLCLDLIHSLQISIKVPMGIPAGQFSNRMERKASVLCTDVCPEMMNPYMEGSLIGADHWMKGLLAQSTFTCLHGQHLKLLLYAWSWIACIFSLRCHERQHLTTFHLGLIFPIGTDHDAPTGKGRKAVVD